jgi:xylan 1,4-beta-xylosidase
VPRAVTALAASAVLAMPGAAAGQSPVVAGDWPDPDVTLIDGSYYAVATSGGWAPTFRILRSNDLRTWEIAGSVFPRAPRWTRDSFWAPELAPLPSGGYALFYSAYPDRAWRTAADGTTVPDRRRAARPWYCLGAATAPTPLGPWRDLGRPLRCTPRGTIDPTPVVDGDELHLVYKEDGNAFGKPTPILLQRLRADGRRLIGRPTELLRNRAPWEGKVVEAPALLRRPDGWLMLYSGALCCSRSCAYAVGAARAPTLAGPWTRFSGNPILRGGNGWRCPGHVSVVGDQVAFHAYRAGPGILAGRQLLIAPLAFRADGWPAIGDGRPLAPSIGAASTDFDDAFAGPALAPAWEWPASHPPGVVVRGGLTLRAPVRSAAVRPRELARRLDAGMVTRRLGSHRFTATAVVRRDSLQGRETAGIAVTRGGPFAIGAEAIGLVLHRHNPADGELAALTVWARGGHRPYERANRVQVSGPLAHLRIEVDGRRHRFLVSSDGASWLPVGPARSSPVSETARVALTVGGARAASARFARASLTAR